METGLKKTEVDTGLKTAEGEMIEMMTEQHRIEVEPSPENRPD